MCAAHISPKHTTMCSYVQASNIQEGFEATRATMTYIITNDGAVDHTRKGLKIQSFPLSHTSDGISLCCTQEHTCYTPLWFGHKQDKYDQIKLIEKTCIVALAYFNLESLLQRHPINNHVCMYLDILPFKAREKE